MMDKKISAVFSVFIILVFIGYIIFDTARSPRVLTTEDLTGENNIIPEAWKISSELKVTEGSLKTVTVSQTGKIYLGGDSFVQCYDKDLNLVWDLKTPDPVTSLSNFGDTIFAATMDLILIISLEGAIVDEWGPYENDGIITSITSNSSYIAFADAGNKIVFTLDKKGDVKSLIGLTGEQFIVPSPYFEVALTSNNLFVANTGHRRVETRTFEGELLSYFGEPGTAPEAFCGCCNPAHFIVIPDGFVTAEKGINRIKILNKNGEFVEFVSSKNKFTASIPLDLASADGKTIYAANPADSKLYIFTRK